MACRPGYSSVDMRKLCEYYKNGDKRNLNISMTMINEHQRESDIQLASHRTLCSKKKLDLLTV